MGDRRGAPSGGGARGKETEGARSARLARSTRSAQSARPTETGDADRRTADGGPGRWVDPIERVEANWHAHGWAAGPWLKTILSIIKVAELRRAAARDILRDYDLTESRHEMLAVLYFSSTGELPMGQIGRRLTVHPARVTSTVGFLEAAGFVERVTSSADRRTVLARITPDGRRAMEGSTEALGAGRFNLDELTEAEAEQLFRILRRVRVAHGDIRATQSPGRQPKPDRGGRRKVAEGDGGTERAPARKATRAAEVRPPVVRS